MNDRLKDLVNFYLTRSSRAVAKTRDWIHGWSLKKLLLDEAVLPHKLEKVFNGVGDSLARLGMLVVCIHGGC